MGTGGPGAAVAKRFAIDAGIDRHKTSQARAPIVNLGSRQRHGPGCDAANVATDRRGQNVVAKVSGANRAVIARRQRSSHGDACAHIFARKSPGHPGHRYPVITDKASQREIAGRQGSVGVAVIDLARAAHQTVQHGRQRRRGDGQRAAGVIDGVVATSTHSALQNGVGASGYGLPCETGQGAAQCVTVDQPGAARCRANGIRQCRISLAEYLRFGVCSDQQGARSHLIG